MTRGSTAARSSNEEPAYSARWALEPRRRSTCHGFVAGSRPAAQFIDERRELAALVVPDDDPPRLELVAELLRDVVVKRMHQASPRSATPNGGGRRALGRHSAAPAGASSRLLSAAFTAGDVRSRTSSSMERVGVLRAVHLPSAPSTQKTSSRPWAMARLRSFAHFGTTRSGQRCIARWAQSYLPVAERVPGGLQLLLPGLVLRDEPPERREVDDDAVVEVRVPERGDALHLVEEGAQLVDERLLRGELPCAGAAVAPSRSSLRERLEAPLLVRELRARRSRSGRGRACPC